MAPWIPRMHLFEIDDQPWFPSFLRAHVQSGLTHAWTICIPILQSCSPATLVANTLRRVLGKSVSAYTYIDFCAGAGGPTPFIEQALNRQLESDSPTTNNGGASSSSTAKNGKASFAAVAAAKPPDSNGRVKFIMTDLHPHISSWEAASKKSEHLTYVPEPVDASNAPTGLIQQHTAAGKKVFRLFNLAFHHFDDDLARAILKNTVETSDGFGIFELQDRTPSSFLSCTLFGVFVLLLAPYFYWWSPERLFFIYVLPVIPFVLVFDGIVSCLRTRTAAEVGHLLGTCGASTANGDTGEWTVHHGREMFLWPIGYMTWIICTKDSEEDAKQDIISANMSASLDTGADTGLASRKGKGKAAKEVSRTQNRGEPPKKVE
ncbi:hypothetical protein F5X96DRAFT_558057 [Biscogniauxia mediterranea]|nr:hypothetical protein F5X96DRAFT_558057 [Biscogniauxia mediterranea]